MTYKIGIAELSRFSGRLLFPEALKSKPKIILIHGKNDDVVPVEDSINAQKILQAEGINCGIPPSPDATHSIAPDRLIKAVQCYEMII